MKKTAAARQTRARIAQEAARLISEHGIRDYYLAKKKAAANLGCVDLGSLPKNTEIEDALQEAVRLFGDGEQLARLAHMRRTGVDLMRSLEQFSPRAVGAVVSGAIGANSALELHLFSDPAEIVAITLLDNAPDLTMAEAKLRFDRERSEIYPSYLFDVDDVAVEITVFGVDGQRQAPLSPVTGRPMQRLTVQALTQLLD